MQQVTSNVFVETNFPGCVVSFVTTKEGIVIIDTPMGPTYALRWRDEIGKRGEARYLINTEHHPDHVTGNRFLPGIVVSSEQTRREIPLMPFEEIRNRVKFVDPDGLDLLDRSKSHAKLPHITFSDRLTLYLGDHTFELINMPGHTIGQSVVYIPQERVLATGDNISYKVQAWLHESDPIKWLESLRRMEEIDADIIVPGHGEVCDKSYISEFYSFIQDWIGAIGEAIDRGLSKEEAVNEISFLDRYPMSPGIESWGPKVQRWNVERLYDVLLENS